MGPVHEQGFTKQSTEREGCSREQQQQYGGLEKGRCLVKETKRCLDINDQSCMGKGIEKREQATKKIYWGGGGFCMYVCMYTCCVHVCEG